MDESSSSAAPRKPDRRILRTRQALRDALMALIHERGYEGITVQDITDKANIARTTFYLHFTDKDDLLFQSMREVYEPLLKALPNLQDAPLSEEADARDFEHVQRHADFYRVMLSERGSMPFLVRVLDLLAESFSETILPPLLPEGAEPQAPLGLLGYALAGMEVAVIAWWLKHDQMATPPPQMARYVEHLCSFGLAWMLNLGLEPPKP